MLVSWNRLKAADVNQQENLDNLIDTEAEWVEKLIELDFEAEKAFFSKKGEEIYFTESGKGNYFHKVNIQDPAKTQRFGPHDLSIEFIAEIPKMDFLTAMNNSGDLYGYRLSSGEIVDSVHTYYADVMHPNGYQLIGASNGNDRSRQLGKLWNIDIARQFSVVLEYRKKARRPAWVKLSPKSNYLAYCLQDTAWVKTLYSPNPARMLATKAKYGEFFHFTFSNNEKYLIAFRGRDNGKPFHSVHEVSSGKKLYEINEPHSLVFTADSKKLIELEADGKAYEREINGGAKGKMLFDAKKNYARTFISPSGKYMVLIGGDKTKKSVLWSKDGSFRELEADYEHISFSKDEKFILAKLSNRMVHIIECKDLNIQKVGNLAGNSPISIIGAETEMMLLNNDQFLLASSGVFHIESGLKVESFNSNHHKERTKPSHIAIDPMGRWKLSITSLGRIQKTPIYTREWLEGNIYHYENLEAER